MKLLLFILSILGALSSGFFLVTLFQTLNTFSEWLVASMIAMILFISVVGVFLTGDWIKEFRNRVRFK